MYKAEASINLPASQQRVWDYVSNYQNFDQFMSHVERVELEGDQISNWKLRGPLGIPVRWKAVTKDFQPPRHLSWQSVDGSLETRGYIQVAEMGGGSKVTVHIEYMPPGGAIGEAFASIFSDPQKLLEHDLEQLGEIVAGWPVEAQDTRHQGYPSNRADGMDTHTGSDMRRNGRNQ
jgi:uncharacterized membrane protein